MGCRHWLDCRRWLDCRGLQDGFGTEVVCLFWVYSLGFLDTATGNRLYSTRSLWNMEIEPTALAWRLLSSTELSL